MTPSIVALTMLLVTGPHSLSVGETRLVIEKSKAHYSEAGIELRVNHIYKMRDKHGDMETIAESRAKFDVYRSFVRRAKLNRRGRVHAILPPMLEPPGILYFGGYGETGCNPKGFSYSNGSGRRSSGGEGYTMSGIAFSHEVAHTLNAKHEEGVANIMHPAALQFTGQPIGFLSSTIYRMKRCLGRGK